MRNRLVFTALLACAAPAMAQSPQSATPEVKSDTVPQPTTANDMAVATGTNVQTPRTAEDSPPAGPEKPAGHIASQAPKTPATPPR
jgi:hypothetical protein